MQLIINQYRNIVPTIKRHIINIFLPRLIPGIVIERQLNNRRRAKIDRCRKGTISALGVNLETIEPRYHQVIHAVAVNVSEQINVR